MQTLENCFLQNCSTVRYSTWPKILAYAYLKFVQVVAPLEVLQEESEVAVDWFTKNEMVVNHDKFQAIVLGNTTPIYLCY